MIYKTNSGYGVNFNQLADARTSSQPIIIGNGVEFSYDDLNNVFNVSGTALRSGGRLNSLFNNIELKANHRYLFDINITGNVDGIYLSNPANNQFIYGTSHPSIYTPSQSYTSVILGTNVINGREYSGTFGLQIFDLTQDFGAGNEPTTVAEFREMYPNDYYDYTLSDWQWAKKGKITSYPTPCFGVDFNQKFNSALPDISTRYGISCTRNNNVFTFSGTATAAAVFSLNYAPPIGHKVLYSPTINRTENLPNWKISQNYLNNIGEPLIRVANRGSCTLYAYFVAGWITDGLSFSLNIFDLTQMYGEGNEPATVEEFRSKFPDTYYPYTLSEMRYIDEKTSYTLLPIEHHIVGLAKNGIKRIEISGNSYQNGTPTPTSPIPIQSFNGTGDTVKLVGASGKELQLPNSITLNNQTISLELNKVGTYADKLIIDKASGKVELVRNVKEVLVDKNTTKTGYSYPDAENRGFAVGPVLDGDYMRNIYSLCDYARSGNYFQGTVVWVGVLNNFIYYIGFYTSAGVSDATGFNAWLGSRVIKTIYGSNYPTTTDITNATYQINGITYNVSDWLNFVDREIEIETDGLAQSNLSVDYEPTLIYNYKKPELSDISLLKLKTGSYKNTNNQGPYVEVLEGNEVVINTPSTDALYGVIFLPMTDVTLKAGHTYYFYVKREKRAGDWNSVTLDPGYVNYFLADNPVITITVDTDKVLTSARVYLNSTSTHYDNFKLTYILTENRQYLIDKGIISQ